MGYYLRVCVETYGSSFVHLSLLESASIAIQLSTNCYKLKENYNQVLKVKGYYVCNGSGEWKTHCFSGGSNIMILHEGLLFSSTSRCGRIRMQILGLRFWMDWVML